MIPDYIFARYRNMLYESARFHERAATSLEGELNQSPEMQRRIREERRLSKVLNQAQGKLRDLQKLGNTDKPLIAFVGLTNAGKSTLLSALFGAQVAPTSNRPWSSVPVEYRYGETFEVCAEFLDTVDSASGRFDTSDEMLDFISQYATAGGGSQSSFLTARMPSPILGEGLVIADTPGFGAAATAGGEIHGEKLVSYLPHADYVFWVIKSLQGITRVEFEFYNKFLSGHCHDVIVNCWDDFSAADRTAFIHTNEKHLEANLNWYFVKAKAAMIGRCRGDEAQVVSSGIHSLEESIQGLVASPERNQRIETQLLKFFSDMRLFRQRTFQVQLFDELARRETLLELGDLDAQSPIVQAMLTSVS